MPLSGTYDGAARDFAGMTVEVKVTTEPAAAPNSGATPRNRPEGQPFRCNAATGGSNGRRPPCGYAPDTRSPTSAPIRRRCCSVLSPHPSRTPRPADRRTGSQFSPPSRRATIIDGFGNAAPASWRRSASPRSRPGSRSRTAACPTRSRPSRAARDRRPARRGARLPARQPLLRDRPADGLRLGAGSATTPPGWARVQAICDYVHDHIIFDYQTADSTRTAVGALEDGTGVCRDFAHLAITLCRCMNIPARYCTGYLGDIGIPPVPVPDGLQRLVRGLSRRPLVHLRRPPQHPADRPHPDGDRPRRHRRRDLDRYGAAKLGEVRGGDRRDHGAAGALTRLAS